LLTNVFKNSIIGIIKETLINTGKRANRMRWVDYTQPKVLTKSLTEKEDAFVSNLVDNKKEPLDAFHAAGYTGKSETVNKARSKRLQRYLWLHIENRIKQRVGETSTVALNVLEELMRSAESENVRLNAARDILSRAGYDAIHRQETVYREASDLSDEELNEQIKDLLDQDNVVSLKPKRKVKD